MLTQSIGINTTYTIGLKVDHTFKSMINTIDLSPMIMNQITNSKNAIFSNKSDTFIADYVMAEYVDNYAVRNHSTPTAEDFWYLTKVGATYSYTKKKPLDYKDFKETYLDKLMTETNTEAMLNDLLRNSIKASIGSSYTKGSTANAWTLYSFPVGGISRHQAYFYYLSNNTLKFLKMSSKVKIDLLEGNLYISSDFPDQIDQLFGYFDVEPLKITATPYLTITGNSEESFYSFKQKSTFGDITVKELTETSYAISFSFNAFIAPSDPYFIIVDGINLLKPRYIPKNTFILVEQKFQIEDEGFLEEAMALFSGVEAKEIGNLASFITNNTEESISTFDKENQATGLFIYKEVTGLAFDTNNALYLPLFKKQDLIREIPNND